MKLRIYGENKKVPREELRLAVRVMIAHLLSRQMLKNITVWVRQRPNLEIADCPVHACMHSRNERQPPRDFTIWINTKDGARAQLRSLAHELTHVKQMATGEVRYLKNGLVRWKDRDRANSRELFAPWEIDASGHEDAVYYAYLDAIRVSGRPGTPRRQKLRR